MSPLALQPHVLIVDDSSIIRYTLSLLFQTEGFTTSSAQDGCDALRQLRVALPDLIITDLDMPFMAGFDFLAMVRGLFPAVPVIVLSGKYDANAFPGELLANAYFCKGQHEPRALMMTATRLVVASRLQPAIAAEPSPGAPL